jgi:hypothetical protein
MTRARGRFVLESLVAEIKKRKRPAAYLAVWFVDFAAESAELARLV